MTSSKPAPLRGAIIGAGYFAGIQMQAWREIEGAVITAVCDLDGDKAKAFAARHGISAVYSDVGELLEHEELDFVDIVTRPDSHLVLVERAAERGLAVLCQKPLAPTFKEAKAIVSLCEAKAVPFMVNENWRWQKWYREIKALLEADTIGAVFHAFVCMRTGDGRGEAPYQHQPYFKDMERFLIFETLVHFIDTLRFLMGDIHSVYATTRRINSLIRGEDLALLTLEFASGATAVIDANRFTEPQARSETFGRVSLEGRLGEIVLELSGDVHVRPNNGPSRLHAYPHPGGYRGGSCQATQAHFVTALMQGLPFETSGVDYLRTLAVVEAAYSSAASSKVVTLAQPEAR
jgi:predicted dehydrogenase